MAAHYFGYMENNVTGRPVAGGTVKVYDSAPSNGGSLVSIYTDEALSDAIDQTSSPLTTDQYGYYEFYTSAAEGYLVYLYNGETKKEIDNVAFIGGTVSTDYTALAARVDKHDTVFGLSASATSLGTFTGSTIADSSSVKVALQALETAVEIASDGLADPNADRILFWDDSAGAKAWLTVGTGLTISGTTLSSDAPTYAQDAAWTFNFSDAADALIYADEAMTLTQQATSGTGTIAYEKSTAAAPSTFASTSSPITLEAGAWLKVLATSVTAPYAVHIKRTA